MDETGAWPGAVGGCCDAGKALRNALNFSACLRSSSSSAGLSLLSAEGMNSGVVPSVLLGSAALPGVGVGALGGTPLGCHLGMLSWKWAEGVAPLVGSE